jgi:hypothetical protein
VRLRGIDVLMEAGRRLEFCWNGGGRLTLPPERCVSVTARPADHDAGLCLVFRFGPGSSRDSGGSRITVSVDVEADQTEAARQFVRSLARLHGVKDVLWSDRRDAGRRTPSRIPRGDPHWLCAPASDGTEALMAWVTHRLVTVDA